MGFPLIADEKKFRLKSANFFRQCLTYPQNADAPLALAELPRRTIGNDASTSKLLI
jgi:hypothetical protein